MTPPIHVRSFVSNTPEYHDAFAAFLNHTDQKELAIQWLQREVARLPQRERFVDVGAGTGKLTAILGESFSQVIAIEPNPTLVDDLRIACPTATVLPTTITAAEFTGLADFILCSHVFYYIPRDEWELHLDRLMSWLNIGGVLIVAIQNPGTDCMAMVDHFIGGRFDLGELCRAAESAPSGRFAARVDTVNASIHTPDLRTACVVAEFVLNVLPMPHPPMWTDLERYIATRFQQPDGSYRMSCNQDFLRVTRVA